MWAVSSPGFLFMGLKVTKPHIDDLYHEIAHMSRVFEALLEQHIVLTELRDFWRVWFYGERHKETDKNGKETLD